MIAMTDYGIDRDDIIDEKLDYINELLRKRGSDEDDFVYVDCSGNFSQGSPPSECDPGEKDTVEDIKIELNGIDITNCVKESLFGLIEEDMLDKHYEECLSSHC